MPEFHDRRASIPAENRTTKGYAAKFYGGSSYSFPDESHMEHMPSLRYAYSSLQDRRRSGGHIGDMVTPLTTDHTGAVAAGEPRHTLFPVVGDDAHMDLHPIRKDGTYDPDVFHRIEVGRRGGVARRSS